MRILYIIHQFLPEFSTGTEVFVMNIAKAQQRSGHYVDVLTCSFGPASAWDGEANGLRRWVADGIPIHAIPQADLGGSAEIGVPCAEDARNTLSRFIERGAYDVAHVAHSMRMQVAVDLIRDFSIPYIVTLTDYYAICHRVILKRPDQSVCSGPEGGRACNAFCADSVMTHHVLDNRRRWVFSFLRDAMAVVACSEFIARTFQTDLPDVPIRVQHHGIALRDFRPPVYKDTSRDLVFGFIGTLSDQKGASILADAFARAAPVNASIEFVGPSYGNVATIERLKAVCNDRIRIIGPIEHRDIPQKLAHFDLLCVPSIWPEPGTLALREGFAAGLPALVSDLGWPGEIVRILGCGAVVSAGDVDAWCRAIRDICERPALLNTWRTFVPMQLTIEEEAFYYEQLYRYALTHRRDRNTLGGGSGGVL